MNSIAMNDFRAEPAEILQAELEACERVLRSGWWILGTEVSSFEREWAKRLDVPHVVGCANGLDAIEIGLRALGIAAGDEVITTSMTAFATVLAVFRAGAIPVLADIDPTTAMLDPGSVRRCVTARTRAILLVHLYGQIGAVREILDIAAQRGIHVIEDCAQAHGARSNGQPAGSFGTFGAWSFYPTKNLGAVGDAGALSTTSRQVAETARSLRNYGQTTRYHHPLLGLNSRMDELQAAILRARLRYLDAWTARRRQIAGRYAMGIEHHAVQLMAAPADRESHVFHLFVITSDRRDALESHLKGRRIDCLMHYPVPVHLQESCRTIRRDPRGLERTEAHANSCLSLPCHPGMTDEQVDTVIAAVNEFRAD